MSELTHSRHDSIPPAAGRGAGTHGRHRVWRELLLVSGPTASAASAVAAARELTGVLVGAGDIAMCGSRAPREPPGLLDLVDGTVFTAGDNAYFQGTAAQYAQCYDPTWGRHKGRTRPAPGNHEYETAGASAYFDYFGESAGPARPRLLQLQRRALARRVDEQQRAGRRRVRRRCSGCATISRPTNARCVAAIWHHPLFSSGQNGPQPMMRDVWRVLRELGADVVIAGHDHIYERFARQDESGRATSGGLREFVVGTGGAELTSPVRAQRQQRNARCRTCSAS